MTTIFGCLARQLAHTLSPTHAPLKTSGNHSSNSKHSIIFQVSRHKSFLKTSLPIPPAPALRPRPGSRNLPVKSQSIDALSSGCSTYLSRVQYALNLLDQAAILLLNLRIRLYGLLDQQLDVPELAEVEIPLPLQAGNRLFEPHILRL